ncbi:hypothetical protein L0B53_15425 [Vibrio sp. SS-MA-C1-2]|nr:hypothetical protein [Vibrio sp. SS-MA-C1-2]UJF18397.1 hypothetical protein L0B53_15425 [Vibrio sp. SS-MA-C1-2]
MTKSKIITLTLHQLVDIQFTNGCTTNSTDVINNQTAMQQNNTKENK